jgi:hypothetical protein
LNVFWHVGHRYPLVGDGFTASSVIFVDVAIRVVRWQGVGVSRLWTFPEPSHNAIAEKGTTRDYHLLLESVSIPVLLHTFQYQKTDNEDMFGLRKNLRRDILSSKFGLLLSQQKLVLTPSRPCYKSSTVLTHSTLLRFSDSADRTRTRQSKKNILFAATPEEHQPLNNKAEYKCGRTCSVSSKARYDLGTDHS